MIKLYVGEISNLIKEVQADEAALKTYFDKLGKKRIEHILKNNRAEDRARSLGVALLLLFALQEEGYQVEKLPDFGYTGKEKPYLREFPQIHFNLSHTKNMIAAVISDNEVGVDIEHIREIKEATINRVFTENEKKMAHYRMEGYVHIWTIKEACAKLLGTGLADILDGLEVFEEEDERKVKKLNQDIRKTFCYNIATEGKLVDSFNNPYYYSVCSKASDNVELVLVKWDANKILFSKL